MGTRDPRVDAYIARSAPFAQPILEHWRALVHETLPDVEEAIKWGMPFFMVKGRMLGNMAAFKAHCAIGFWKGDQVVGAESKSDEAMGQLGRLTSLADLPPKKTLVGYLKSATALREAPPAAKQAAAKKKVPKPPVVVPPWLAAALERDPKARATFDAFPPSHRREYVEWLVEAKTEATREKRLATALEWLAEGKARNWKYEKAR